MRRTLVVALLAGACANSRPAAPDAGEVDAAPTGGRKVEAEMVSAGGRVSAGTLTMDVEIGHWFERRVTRAGSRTLIGTVVVEE